MARAVSGLVKSHLCYFFHAFLQWGRGVPDHVSFEAGTDVVDYQIAFGGKTPRI
jgi:hypothetical protein